MSWMIHFLRYQSLYLQHENQSVDIKYHYQELLNQEITQLDEYLKRKELEQKNKGNLFLAKKVNTLKNSL